MPQRPDPTESPPRYAWRIALQHQTAIVAVVVLAVGLIVVGTAGLSWSLPQTNPLAPKFAADINSATQGELVAIPGVGPSLATAIVEHRSKHGRFKSLEALTDVPGIGPKTSQRLAKFLLPVE